MDNESTETKDESFTNKFSTQLRGPNGELTDLLKDFAQSIFDISWNFMGTNHNSQRDTKILQLLSPDEIRSQVDLSIPHQGESLQNLIEYVKKTFALGVSNNHPRFFNQLYAAPDPVGLLGEWVSSVANTNIHTYEVAPFFILVENEVLQHMRNLIGYANNQGDGIFAPGGSIANMYGLLLARNRAAPHIKTLGFKGDENLVFFTSDQSHYSFKKMANVVGLGMNSLISVSCDESGKMNTDELETKVKEALSRGKTPFFVNGTAGTTVLGAFDNFTQISNIAKKYNMWFHIDAALGGSCLISSAHSSLMSGCLNADSVAWNAHKAMGIPLQCSAFLTRESNLLQQNFTTKADYLFQSDKLFGEYDVGDKTFMCGRKTDAYKLWLTWKSRGINGYSQLMDTSFSLAQYLVQQINGKPNFKLVVEQPQFLNVCFWFLPESIRNINNQEEKNLKLHSLTAEIKSRMQARGNTLVAYQPLSGKPNFFKVVTISPFISKGDLDFVLEEIEKIGTEITIKQKTD